MTMQDKVTARTMLLNGSTYEEAARAVGVTRQRVHQLFPDMSQRTKRGGRKTPYQNWRAPSAFSEFCMSKGLCGKKVASEIGMPYTSFIKVMRGSAYPSLKYIDQMSRFSGVDVATFVNYYTNGGE